MLLCHDPQHAGVCQPAGHALPRVGVPLGSAVCTQAHQDVLGHHYYLHGGMLAFIPIVPQNLVRFDYSAILNKLTA